MIARNQNGHCMGCGGYEECRPGCALYLAELSKKIGPVALGPSRYLLALAREDFPDGLTISVGGGVLLTVDVPMPSTVLSVAYDRSRPIDYRGVAVRSVHIESGAYEGSPASLISGGGSVSVDAAMDVIVGARLLEGDRIALELVNTFAHQAGLPPLAWLCAVAS